MRYLWRVVFIALVAASLGQSCSPQTLFSPGGDGGGDDAADDALRGINGGEPAQSIPELGGAVSIQIVSQSSIDARVIIRYLVGEAESHLADLAVPSMRTLEPVGPDLATVVNITVAYANGKTLPLMQLRLGQEFAEGDLKIIILTDPEDECPSDPDKTAPGVCGCGVPDADTDGDGTPDCLDACPNDPAKTAPGICGCGVADIDTDHDATPDCLDACPDDPAKVAPGVCGCGVADVDTDKDGTPDCLDGCPADPLKIAPGSCGCGQSDYDYDGDGVPDCIDSCPDDPHKVVPGACGCGTPDIDTDQDGHLDCFDNCPNVFNPYQEDYDQDGVGNACEIRADIDGDGDVDLEDFGILQACLLSPGDGCYRANVDRDPYCLINHKDLEALNFCFTGSGIPLTVAAPPACWGEETGTPPCDF